MSPHRATANVIEMAAGDLRWCDAADLERVRRQADGQIMNMMGIDLDGLGNHNFDRGARLSPDAADPAGRLPACPANVVDADGKTPAEWSPSKVFKFGGVKIGVRRLHERVDTGDRRSRAALDPFVVPAVVPAVNAEAAKLDKKADAIVAIGHEGATGGTVDDPTGPLHRHRGRRRRTSTP